MTKIMVSKDELDVAAKILSANSEAISEQIVILNNLLEQIPSLWEGPAATEFLSKINIFIRELDSVGKSIFEYSKKIYDGSDSLKNIASTYATKAGEEE